LLGRPRANRIPVLEIPDGNERPRAEPDPARQREIRVQPDDQRSATVATEPDGERIPRIRRKGVAPPLGTTRPVSKSDQTCGASSAQAAEGEDRVELDRVRRDARLAVVVVEERDPGDGGADAQPNGGPCSAHLGSPGRERPGGCSRAPAPRRPSSPRPPGGPSGSPRRLLAGPEAPRR